MNLKILYKFPSRSRPTKFFAALDNIHELSTHGNFEILATLDIDDSTMANEEVKQRLLQYPKVRAMYGTSTGKLNAVNRDMEFAGEYDLCIVWSDDMKALVKGFDSIIVEKMKEHHPGGDGILFFPDSHAKFELSTLAILTKKYYDRFGYIYNPEYTTVWGDNEYTEVARILNKCAFVPMRIFDHFHPAWGMCEKDALYLRNENPNIYVPDNMTYIKRKAISFGLNIFQ